MKAPATKKFELKKIHYSASLSEETSAYSAQLWVDGVHVLDVSNHGQGGPDEQHPAKGQPRNVVEELNAYCKQHFPPMVCSFIDEKTGEPALIHHDVEMLCGNLLSDYLVEKDVKRLLKTKILWVEDGKLWNVSIPKKMTQEMHAKWFSLVRTKYAGVKFLNDMSIADAVKAYNSCTN